jgi:malonyl-CoA/methylmalonyl-CoA synthetase
MPLPTVETRISNDELWIKGPSVFAGYWKREDATREAFEEGWFKTGDTVLRDDAGYFRILGRTSVDILKSGGYKLSALEIEEVLREHPSVAEVAVVGLPDPAWGERVVACVVARPGHDVDEAALRAFAKERVAAYKVPKNIVAIGELPRNTMGKVVKPDLLRLVKRLTELS